MPVILPPDSDNSGMLAAETRPRPLRRRLAAAFKDDDDREEAP